MLHFIYLINLGENLVTRVHSSYLQCEKQYIDHLQGSTLEEQNLRKNDNVIRYLICPTSEQIN